MQLLADVEGRVRAQYGIKPSLGLFDGRETFIIDKHGIVRHVFRSQVQVTRHVKESLAVLARLQSD
jgi:peroxiredoxin Q/BCP